MIGYRARLMMVVVHLHWMHWMRGLVCPCYYYLPIMITRLVVY